MEKNGLVAVHKLTLMVTFGSMLQVAGVGLLVAGFFALEYLTICTLQVRYYSGRFIPTGRIDIKVIVLLEDIFAFILRKERIQLSRARLG
jgi:hypothetical protein